VIEYLASPYTHTDATVRQARYEAACRAAAELMLRGRVVFSPIAHSHPIEAHMPHAQSEEFWLRQCRPLLQACSRVAVLCLDGWQESRGLAEEIRIARERGIQVHFL